MALLVSVTSRLRKRPPSRILGGSADRSRVHGRHRRCGLDPELEETCLPRDRALGDSLVRQLVGRARAANAVRELLAAPQTCLDWVAAIDGVKAVLRERDLLVTGGDLMNRTAWALLLAEMTGAAVAKLAGADGLSRRKFATAFPDSTAWFSKLSRPGHAETLGFVRVRRVRRTPLALLRVRACPAHLGYAARAGLALVARPPPPSSHERRLG